MTESFSVESPIGIIKVTICDDQLQSIEFAPKGIPTAAVSAEALSLEKQLASFFDDPRQGLQVKIKKQGTLFQQRVWEALRSIPCGQVVTYGALARELGSSARAIGNACRRNPTPIVVPCHRVVSANGLGGFAGATSGQLTDIKQKLLQIEDVQLNTQLELEVV